MRHSYTHAHTLTHNFHVETPYPRYHVYGHFTKVDTSKPTERLRGGGKGREMGGDSGSFCKLFKKHHGRGKGRDEFKANQRTQISCSQPINGNTLIAARNTDKMTNE